MKTDFSYPDEKFLIRLGMVTISFSDLESSLGMMLEVVVNPSNQLGTILSSHLSFARTIDVISASYKHLWPECVRQSELAALLTRCQKAEEERNQIVHSTYGFPDETRSELLARMKSSATRKHGLRHSTKEVSVKDLEQYLNELVSLTSQVTAFAFWIFRNHHESPGEPTQPATTQTMTNHRVETDA